jgi:hypothetical protein
MLVDSPLIPRILFHHQVLFDAVDGIVPVVFLLSLRHEIAQTGVLAVADQAEVAERVERVGWQCVMPRKRILGIVMFHRASECELVSFDDGVGILVLKPKQIVEIVKYKVVFYVPERKPAA